MSSLNSVEHRKNGRSLTDEDHAQRSVDQGERVTERIAEIMAGENPLQNLFQAKLAHRGLGFDLLFDEAISELKTAFNFLPAQIQDASLQAFQLERERKQKIKDAAKGAARRAGLIQEEKEPAPVDVNV